MTSIPCDPTPEEFIRLRAQGLTIQAIAERWHFATRDSVYQRLKKWRNAGLLESSCPSTLDGCRIRARNGRIVRSPHHEPDE